MSKRKIVDYKIEITWLGSEDGYRKIILEEIRDGWQPIGGVSSTLRDDGAVILFQAMVKYED